MPPVQSSWSRRNSGQAVLVVTLGIIAMFGMLGLVVDIGWAYFRRHAAQAAAEAAALAAAEAAIVSGEGSFVCGSKGVACQEAAPCPGSQEPPPAGNLASGCLYAAANGFRHRGRQTVRMSAGNTSPAPTAPGVAVRYWVTAEVSESIPQLFSAVLGNRVLTPAARATAGVYVLAENACIYALHPSARAAFSAGGGAVVSAGGCDIYVNSSDSSALIVGGAAQVNTGGILVTGGYELNGGGQAVPTPATGVPHMPDPFVNLPSPSFGGCTHMNLKVKGGATTLQPGVYCKGIEINQQAQVTFAPGIYVLNGGGFSLSGGAAVAGAGVMFYNTARDYAFGPIAISGGTTTELSAPTSGTYKGVLFFQDRNVVSNSSNDFTGGAGMNLNGTLYLPSGDIKFAGGSENQAPFTALLARTITFTGNSKFKPDPTGEHTGLARRTSALIE